MKGFAYEVKNFYKMIFQLFMRGHGLLMSTWSQKLQNRVFTIFNTFSKNQTINFGFLFVIFRVKLKVTSTAYFKNVSKNLVVFFFLY